MSLQQRLSSSGLLPDDPDIEQGGHSAAFSLSRHAAGVSDFLMLC